MIEIKVDRFVRIKGMGKEHVATIKKVLTLDNPVWHKMFRMGNAKAVWGVKKEFIYWKQDGEWLVIPRGCEERVRRFLTKNNLEAVWSYDLVAKKLTKKTTPTAVLRDYQVPLVEAVMSKIETSDNRNRISVSGIIHAGTGSGKTILSTELIHRIGMTATILVPTIPIMQQFIETLRDQYGIEAGQVGDGKKDVKEVTVAMIQSLDSDAHLLEKLAGETSVLIVDECQAFCTDKRLNILSKFKPSILLGLTATPKRTKDDGRTDAIFFTFGGVIAQYEMTQLQPTVKVIRTGVAIEVDDYAQMVEAMVENEKRNKLIAGIVMGETLSGRKVLVLTKRRAHYWNIGKHLSEDVRQSGMYLFIDSGDKERNNILRRLKTGEQEFFAVFGTTSLLAVGLDIPAFDTLILACDMKSDVLLVQSAGRILRVFLGKQDPLIYDLYDDKNPFFARQHWERRKVYGAKGWKVI